MNKIAAFTRLDFYTLKPYRNSLLLLVAMAVVMTAAFRSVSTLTFYLMMSLTLVMMYPFSIGETGRLDTLYATLPLKRGDAVAGRYLFVLCMEAAVVLMILVLGWFFSAFAGMELIAEEMAFNLSVASCLFSTIVAFQYPFYFKLGYNKAKFFAMAPFLIFFLAVITLPNALKNASPGVDLDELLMSANSPALCAGLVLAGHALLALSYVISRKLYAGRDL